MSKKRAPLLRQDGAAEPEIDQTTPVDTEPPIPILSEDMYAFSLIKNLNNDPRPHVDVEVEGVMLTGLLDSGASVTILGSGAEDVRRLANIPRQRTNTTIKTADGTIHAATNYLLIPFIFNNQRHTIPTLDTPSISKLLILGVDFWDAFGIRPSITQFVGGAKPVSAICVW